MSWLSGWTKRKHLTVDHSKVDEDLTNFPVMIHLASSMGRNNADVSDIFDELAYVSIDDDFTGTNGNYLNSDRWELYNTPSVNSTIRISNNNARITLYSSDSGDINERTVFCVSGDFDVQLDFDVIDDLSTTAWFGGLLFRANDSSGYWGSVGPGYTTSDKHYRFRYNGSGGSSDSRVSRSVSSGVARVTRTGSYVSGYYWNGSSWSQIGSQQNWGANDVFFTLYGYKSFTSSQLRIDYDNFIVNSGDIFWPQKTFPNRKKLFLTDDSDTPLYMEIERWDQANKEASLWAKVPTVYSGSDTDLYLYYDSSQSDNTSYVGDTGDSVAQNVWDVHFRMVHHMSQDPTGGTDCILDSTSNGNNGTPDGSMTSDDLVDGLVGKALDFDGTDDEIDIDVPTALPSQYLSVECLVYVDAMEDWHNFVWHNWQSSNGSWVLFTSTTGIHFGLYYSGSYTAHYTTDISGGWHYVTGIYDGANGRLYLDGYEVGTPTAISSLSLDTTNAVKFSTNHHAKKIDEARISNIVRSAAHIKATNYSLTDQLVQVEPAYYIDGYVYEQGSPVSRMLFLHNRSTGNLVNTTTSSGNGYYYLETSFSGSHYVVCLDAAGGENYNDLIIGNVTPTTISG